MTLMDDSVTVALLVSAAFFVALSFGLMLRYRQVSQKITASSDLGRDLWQALEQRMRKQDERILDMMGRLEVVQSRVMTAAAAQTSVSLPPLPPIVPRPMVEEPAPRDVIPHGPAAQQPESQVTSRAEPLESQVHPEGIQLDETRMRAIRLLGESPKNTRQITDALGMSREHTARMMKELFGLGLVRRNDSTKPFVYQLTDEGSRLLSVS
jgi:DNA-binding transcriptional ArsR family regulator